MMVYLSECKFGDKLKTRDGRMAVFLGASFGVARGFDCVIEDKKIVISPCYTEKTERCHMVLLTMIMT